MNDWDDDSAQLRANLRRVLLDVRKHARQRATPTVEAARRWHSGIMHRLTPPDPRYVGRFRGESGLEDCEVVVGDHRGVASDRIAHELKTFEARLQSAVEALDGLIDPDRDLSADQVAAVIDLCAWVHAEWVRMHPFANGNGRTARLWANQIAMRYGLPPFVRLRPRPDDGYAAACAAAMIGRWQATAQFFKQMYREAIRR
jgi:Fic family protein